MYPLLLEIKNNKEKVILRLKTSGAFNFKVSAKERNEFFYNIALKKTAA